MLLSVQSAVAVNPLRALFGSKSNTPLLHNDPTAIVSTDGRVNVRNPRILQVADGQDFVTLTCNTNIDWNSVPCVPWVSTRSLFRGAGLISTVFQSFDFSSTADLYIYHSSLLSLTMPHP